MDILIFKTDISSRKRAFDLRRRLQALPGIHKCNVDLQDIDKILRIESDDVASIHIEQLVQQAGYLCEELEG